VSDPSFFRALLESPQWLLAYGLGPLLLYGIILDYRGRRRG